MDAVRPRPSFDRWYASWAQRLKLNPNPDDPRHFYDYRAAYAAGAEPNAEGHWPSEFKLEGHPNLVVNGMDTRTGLPTSYVRMFRKIIGRDPNTAELEHEQHRRQQAPYADVAPINQPAAMREPSLHDVPTPAEKWVLNRLTPEDQAMREAYATPGSALRHLGQQFVQGIGGVGEFLTSPLSLLRARLHEVDRDTHQGRVEAAQNAPVPPTSGEVLAGLNPMAQARGMFDQFGRDPAGALAALSGMEFAGGALHAAQPPVMERPPVAPSTAIMPTDWSSFSSPARTGAPMPAVGDLNLNVPTVLREPYQHARAPMTPDASLAAPTILRRQQIEARISGVPEAAEQVGGAQAQSLLDQMGESGFAGGKPAAGVDLPPGAGYPTTVDAIKQATAAVGHDAFARLVGDEVARRGAPDDPTTVMAATEEVARGIAARPGPYEQTPFRAAIELPSGQIVSGRTHLDAIHKVEAAGYTGDLTDARDGFIRVNEPNTLLSRHETEQLMGLPRTTGGLGSEDLLGGTDRLNPIGNERGMIGPLYHGSPHDFNQFDISKVGTGEGAAAYGHGLYFASAKDVGEYYRNQLAGEPEITHLRLGGLDVGPHNSFDYSPKGTTLEENIRSSLTEDLLINQQDLTAAGPKGVQKLALDMLDDRIARYKDEWPEGVAPAQRLRAQLAKKGAVSLDMIEHPGKLYTVDVDAHPEQLLDWDAPLRKQPTQVQSIVRAKLKELKYLGPRDNGPIQLTRAWKSYVMERARGLEGDKGDTIYHTLLDGAHKGPEASALLHKAGIKGIRYLDANSRDAGTQKTRNYVIFHHDAIKIKDKGQVALKMLGLTGAAAGGALTAGLMTHDDDKKKLLGALAGLGVAGALGMRLGRVGAVGPIANIIAEGLSKAEAVERMKALSDAGERAQMRPQPDGSFAIVRKGEPGTALAKPAPKEIARIGPQGDAQDAGFQSRLLTTVEQGKWPEKGMTPDEWYKRLSNSPNVPKAELDAVMEPLRVAPVDRAHAFDVYSDKHDNGGWMRVKRILSDGSEDITAADMRRSLLEHHPDYIGEKDLLVVPAGQPLAFGEGGRITAKQLVKHIQDNSPATRLERTTLKADDGGRPQMTESDIDREVEYQAESWAESKREESGEAIRSRNQRLMKVHEHLQSIFGNEGGDRAFKQIAEDLLPEGAETWMKQQGGTAGRHSYPFADWSHSELKDYESGLPDEVRDAVKALQHPDATQLPLAAPIDPSLTGLSAFMGRMGLRGPELSNATINEIMGRLEHASDYQDEAVQHLLDAENPDYDHLRDWAIQSLEETGDYGEGRDAGDTEYSTYQRVDEDAPYREILINDPELGTEGGHFHRGEIAHARGEIHGDTYLMIETQSDPGQRANRRGMANSALEESPFRPTDRWAQLGTGASLIQAAEEGSDTFAWVTPEDRMRRANLAKTAAHNTYGLAVPKAVERIFKWLDEPMEVKMKKLQGGTFPSVELTPEMRKKILKAGVPALGIAAVTAGGLTQAKQQRLEQRIRGN